MAEQNHHEENLSREIGVIQQCKHGETICGDHFVVSREDNRIQIVLSDGLGSGVQANIASTLTATLISGLTKRGLPLEDCIRSVAAVLPITKKHNLAYATFSLVSTEGRQVQIVQYDNPPAVFLRDGVSLTYPFESHTILEKTLQKSVLTMKKDDMLVLFSDGVSEAGRGVTTYSGWDRRQMEDYLFRSVHPDDYARHVAANIISAVQALDLFEFHDDTTVIVLRLRERLAANMLISFSDAWKPDESVLLSFFAKEGLHIICGKGAAHAVTSSGIDGIDLTVEGDYPFTEILSLIQHYQRDGMMSLDLEQAQDGASLLLKMLAEEASEVNILFHAEFDGEQTESDSAAMQKPEQVFCLQQLMTELGKTVTLNFC
ncbi:MAG: serine/threonine-protein phosphatase [Oscillospiraceae bacterium]|nr:serine/threonine-protein phosphatase [Oscillospiraceae bacterium]